MLDIKLKYVTKVTCGFHHIERALYILNFIMKCVHYAKPDEY